MDPNNKCHNTTCGNQVHVSKLGKHFYCLNHMRCGTETNGKPCDGCMTTIQGSMKDMDSKFREITKNQSKSTNPTNPILNNRNNNLTTTSEVVIEITI